ncbi:MAG: hypothetical protein L3J29_05380 [Cyclobacteriaceae bacterium]|nr:hypothetical protein [Cyclobacteriaceae bacterium]
MITKSQIIHTLEGMPEKVTIDQVVDQLVFLDKVQKGISDSDKDNVHSKEATKQRLSKWLK